MTNYKPDIKDIKLISAISRNSRLNYSQIAKKIEISNESAKLRMDRLLNSGILKALKTNLNYSKLGFSEFDIYFKLRNYSQEELNTTIKYLEEDNNTTWIATCFGRFDIRISIIVKNMNQIDEFIERFKHKFPNKITDYYICYISKKYRIDQIKTTSNLFNIDPKKIQHLFDEKLIIDRDSQNIRTQTYTLDETDKKIIQVLNKDTRASLVQIGQTLDMTAEAVKYRLKELEKKQIIQGYTIIADGDKLNKIWAVCLFKLTNENPKQFLQFLSQNSNISSFVKIIGNWNYSVSVFASNIKEIHNVFINFRNSFPNLIQDYEMVVIFETYKYPKIPKCVFE